MKKLLFTLFLGLIIIVGCVTSKKAQQSQEPNAPDEVQSQMPIPWLQDIDPDIVVGDPIVFYNLYKIIVYRKIPIVLKEYKDGKLAIKDSAVVFDYSVPSMTAGKIIRVDKRNGKPTSFVVCFNENADPNYNHTFNVNTDKSFTMIASTTILVDGVEYKVNAVIDGIGDRLCRLLYYPEVTTGQSQIGAPASGVAIPVGVRPIK